MCALSGEHLQNWNAVEVMHLKEPVIKMKSDEASTGVVCRAHSSFIFPVPLHSEPTDTAEMAIRM